MFAVVKIAGQQFRVTKDQTLYVPHLAGNAGDKVEFPEVLLVDADGALTVGKDVKATIKAEIVSHGGEPNQPLITRDRPHTRRQTGAPG